jgi:hypothetical protein
MITTQNCPNCGATGMVYRSLPRDRREKLLRVLFPVYGTYRCHKCNWRGWMPRGSTTPFVRKLLITLYTTLALVIVAWAVATIVERWPRPRYEYPIPGLKK